MKNYYPGIPADFKVEIATALAKFSFCLEKDLLRGSLFSRPDGSAIIVDYNICDTNFPFHYSDYTKEQNALTHLHKSVYRLAIDDPDELEDEVETLQSLLGKGFESVDEREIRTFGQNRYKQAIDPTLPESYFENAFLEIYGQEKFCYISREVPLIDIKGHTRYVDYYIERKGGNIAVGKNGETYHHPQLVGKEKYRRQLLKQNSIVAYGDKVFRWSLESMKFADRFHEEIRVFLGSSENFIRSQNVSLNRNFGLYNFQEDSLTTLRNSRNNGQDSALVVLPTGTGKTEILVEEVFEQLRVNSSARILIIAPTRNLRAQLERVVRTRIVVPTGCKIGNDPASDRIVVQTYSWLCRHFREFSQDYFNYIAVDEAHHAMAPTLEKAIHHFKPGFILGMTATDQRLDKKRLENVFGKYETNLSLEEAIEQNFLSPIRVFRIKTGIDLSEVRFNGRDYVASDLQRRIKVPSRDQLIVDVLEKYFGNSKIGFKSGLIFCVSIDHANSIAKRLNDAGFSAIAVSGQERKSDEYIKKYETGEIQFLTTCSLLSEGWDSPRTSIIVMARPTMSKVLYTQQIGRGTRLYPGKEALIIIDVVDNYGAIGPIKNAPWSIHAIFGCSFYLPWHNPLNPGDTGNELETIISLHEETREIEEINIFTFERVYPDHIGVEQLARELFVATDTVNNWIKNKKIRPDVTIPFGKSELRYFAKASIEAIRKSLGLKKHDETTIYEDFFEFLEERDYSLSYKMVMMLSFLKLADDMGECNLDELTEEFKAFYIDRLSQNIRVDKKSCPFSLEMLKDNDSIKKSILRNPFEKFERKRFMYHCKDLNRISFSSILWSRLNLQVDLKRIKDQMIADLQNYYLDLDGITNLDYWQDRWL